MLGMSADSVKTHERFAVKLELPFPLLSDADKAVMQAYGMMKNKSMYGKTFLGIERMTFVIDREGTIRRIWPKVKVEGHAAEVLEYVRQL